MATKTMRKRTYTFDVVYENPEERPQPGEVADQARDLLKALPGTHEVRVDYSLPEFTDVEVPDPVNRTKLIGVVTWVAGEAAKKEMGLPSEWDQDWWYRGMGDEDGNWCGTACCVAGKVAIDAGGVPLIEPRVGSMSDRVEMPNGDREFAREVARRELGLTEFQASALFAANNRLEDIVRVAREILDGVEVPTGRDTPLS